MNILAIILSIMVLTSQKLRFVIKLLLDSIICYWLFHLKFPSVAPILNIEQYTPQLIQSWVQSKYFGYVIFYFALSHIFFYVLIKFLLGLFIGKEISKSLTKLLASATEEQRRKAKAILINGIRTAARKYKLGNAISTFYNVFKQGQLTFKDFSNLVYNYFCISIHMIACIIIIKGFSISLLILFVTIILLGVLIIRSIPYSKRMFDEIPDALEHESNVSKKD